MNVKKDEWLINFNAATATPKMQLICFPFAGGGTLNYSKWRKDLDSEIHLSAFNFPGRERLFSQECLTNYQDLIQRVTTLIEEQAKACPMIFFGHSFGALTAYFTSLELKKRNLRTPVHLYVSARLPPCLEHLDKIGQLPQAQFKSIIINRYHGVPPQIMNDPELLDLFIHIIQKDFILYEQYPEVLGFYENHLLDCDLTSISFREDIPKEEDFFLWNNYTNKAHRHIQLPGGHFEIINHWKSIVDLINTASYATP